MKVKLPIQTTEIVEKEIINSENEKDIKLEMVKTKGEKEFELDITLASQMRYEKKFPELANKEDLFEYSKRISAVKQLSTAVTISKMKTLYCWLDTEIEFIDFLKMFDFSDLEYTDKLTKTIHKIFELVFNSSAEKN